MIIDFHTHIVSPEIREKRDEYARRDACFSILYSQPKAKLATAEELITSMDECGIDKSVILGLGLVDHELCVEVNDYILESATRYPNRLMGFCTVQPKAGDKALKELERCASGGAKGIGEMRPDVQGFDLGNSAMMSPLIQALEAHNLILLIHASEPVGHQYFGKGNITPEFIYPFIQKFPTLKLVCAHWGGGLPFYALMPEVDQALSNTFFDTAATPFLYKPQIFDNVADIAGCEKILFGSDYPLLSPKRVLDQINTVELSPENKAKVLGGNAATLLGIN